MAEVVKRRQPGKRVFEKPKPALTLIKPTQEHKPISMDDEVKEMLREMSRRQKDTRDSATNGSDTPDAA